MSASSQRKHAKWANHLIKHADRLLPHGIELGRQLGCGEFGCAFSIGQNRVLKVTRSKDEAGTWDVIAEEQKRSPRAMYGIATVYGRPFGIFIPSRQKLLYGIIREGLTNVPNTYRNYNGIIPIDGPSVRNDPTPLNELEKMVKHVPETELMASAIHHLYHETGGIYFLPDLHTKNVGKRYGEKWYILRDPGWAWTPTAGREFDLWQPSHTIQV